MLIFYDKKTHWLCMLTENFEMIFLIVTKSWQQMKLWCRKIWSFFNSFFRNPLIFFVHFSWDFFSFYSIEYYYVNIHWKFQRNIFDSLKVMAKTLKTSVYSYLSRPDSVVENINIFKTTHTLKFNCFSITFFSQTA